MATLQYRAKGVLSSRVAVSVHVPLHGRRAASALPATVAFLEANNSMDLEQLRAARQRVYDLNAQLALNIKESALEAPARRVAKDRALLASYIRRAAQQRTTVVYTAKGWEEASNL